MVGRGEIRIGEHGLVERDDGRHADDPQFSERTAGAAQACVAIRRVDDEFG